MEDFNKDDKGKARYDLIPEECLQTVVEVLTHGAKKYGDENWRKCDDLNRYFAAAQRHIWAWKRGGETDEETGISHLAHAICNLMFLEEMN